MESGINISQQKTNSDDLVIEIDGYEGPLDVLLSLARSQKVDLRQISVLQLALQYLEFVERAKQLRLELAADYLVMAAWLAYLKSRLILPQAQEEGPSADELAAQLAFQLERLDAMRQSAAKLMARDQLGRDFFARGIPQDVVIRKKVVYKATILDLMQAYARLRTKADFTPLNIKERDRIVTMEQSLDHMRGLIGHALEWGDLHQFLPAGWQDDAKFRRSAIAATFAAALELVKEGTIDIRQGDVFAPIEIKSKGKHA